ncbi:hypothetical protein CH381_06395 [Leptospira sp. mixed culture ATI2-C-A1]|nr:hypothetical protein CH381_06395 [Leptospira sp. mixed culture ATI2-C-A1]
MKNYIFLTFACILIMGNCRGFADEALKKDIDDDKYNHYIIFEYLISNSNRCPTVNLTLEKGINYPITLSSETEYLINFSSVNNLPPPNQIREYFLIVTKDPTTSIEFKVNRLCNTMPATTAITSPESATSTELRYRLITNDVRTLENAFSLKLKSGSANVSLRQE